MELTRWTNVPQSLPETETRSNNTGQKQDTRFRPGRSGNPGGRPKSARNNHSENFINAFAQDFEQHGAAVIEKVRTERPHDYLKVAAALLPKQIWCFAALLICGYASRF